VCVCGAGTVLLCEVELSVCRPAYGRRIITRLLLPVPCRQRVGGGRASDKTVYSIRPDLDGLCVYLWVRKQGQEVYQ